MIVDASAVVALIQAEPEAFEIIGALADAGSVGIAAPTATECLIVLSHRYGPVGRAIYERVRTEFHFETVAFTDIDVGMAHSAYLRFGKGRHPAALNFGDCMAYAVAKSVGESLLCVGDDFPQTDLVFDGVIGRWPGSPD